jgi:hypothetical protein
MPAAIGLYRPHRRLSEIANATLIMRSNVNRDGIKLDTGTGLLLWNSVVTRGRTENTGACVQMQDDNTMTTMNGITGAQAFKSVFFSCASSGRAATGNAGFTTTFTTADVQTLLAAGANNVTAGVSSLADFVNGTNETAVTAQDATTLNTANNNNLGFFVKTTYIGAVKDSTDTWWQGWSCGLDATAC